MLTFMPKWHYVAIEHMRGGCKCNDCVVERTQRYALYAHGAALAMYTIAVHGR